MLGGAAATWPIVARAQQPAKLPTIGFLGPNTPSIDGPGSAPFAATARTRLDRGSQSSRSSIAGGKDASSAWPRSRPSSSAEGGCHCHVGNPRSRRGKASDIGHPDRVRGGGGPGRHRPGRESGATGRQRTGLSLQATDLAGKRLELLREVVPGLRRLAIMANSDTPAAVVEMREVQATARTLGLEVVASEIRRPEDIAPAFEALKGRAEALYVCNRPTRNHSPDQHQHLGVGRAAADDV